MAYFLFLNFFIIFPLIWAFPDGAPKGACGHMTPGHRDGQTIISPQTVAGPYNITADTNVYTLSGKVTVSVTGQYFRGILLQARQDDNTIVGTFSNPPPNTKLIRCTNRNDTVTHANVTSKDAGTSFTWTAPDFDAGPITFTATVVQEYATFWVMLKSEKLTSGAAWICCHYGLLVSLLLVSYSFIRQ